MSAAPWPLDLAYSRSRRMLDVAFDDGTRASLPAELLRVESPSAEVRGHGAGPKQAVPGKREVAISGMQRVGHYAVRLQFDDGHDSGLYSWALLHAMARTQDQLWADYLDRLAAAGLSRDR